MLKITKLENGIKISNGKRFVKIENGFITIDAGTSTERVIWVPFEVFNKKARERVAQIMDNYTGETKFDYSHTRVKLTAEQEKEIKDTYNELKAEYSFKPVAQIEIASDTQSGSLGVCCSGEKTSVVSLSPKLYNGHYSQEDWENSVKSGFHPKGTGNMVKSVMMHELGHSITVNSEKSEFWSEIESIRKDYLKNIKKDDIDNPNFISNYARVNKEEFVAEAFCQGKLSNSFGEYTRQVMKQIDKHFKKGYQHEMFNSAIKEDKKQNPNNIWVEGLGMGYPLNEEDYERMQKRIMKANKNNV